jgi:tetratricopeptide (TPR) repeat protein
LVGNDDDALRVRLLESIATNLYYIDAGREGEVAHRALEIAERLNRPTELASVQRSLHLWYSHRPEARRERLESGRRAYELAYEAPAAGRLRLIAHRGLVVDLLENREVGEYERSLEAYARAADELASPPDIYWATALRAAQVTMHGDLEAAEQLARGALLRGHELDQISDGAYFLQRFLIRYQQARLNEEIPALEAAASASTVFRAGAALHAIGLCETGHHSRAMNVAWSTIESDGSGLPKDAFWLAGMSLFAGVAATIRDRDLAALLQPMLEPCADHVVLFGAGAAMLGSGHHWLGGLHATLGNVDASVEHFDAADAIARRVRAPYWEAQAKLDKALVLRSRGEGRATEAAIGDAVGIAERWGYRRVLTRVQALP